MRVPARAARVRRTGAPWVRRATFVAVLALQAAVLYWPSTPEPAVAVPGLDAVVHLLVFAAAAWAGRWAGVPLRPLVAGLVAHAVLSELVQHALLAHRSGDPADVVADLAGLGLGLLLPAPARWRRRRSTAGASWGRAAPRS